jgi:hypothetical protein
MRKMLHAYRLLFPLLCVAWLWWAWGKTPAREHGPLLVITIAFLAVYVLPWVIFGANVELVEDGLLVTQHVKLLVPASDLWRVYSLFLFPFRFVLVITTRPLPLKFLLVPDPPVRGIRKSDLAQRIQLLQTTQRPSPGIS